MPRGMSSIGTWVAISSVLPVALLLLLPASTAAAAGDEIRFKSLVAKGETRSGFAYKLVADRVSVGPKGSDGRPAVSLTLRSGEREQGSRARFDTFYAPAGRRRQGFGPRRLNATLGERGSVGMRFRERSRRVQKLGNCGRSVVRRGALVGHLRFRGEAGYVRILVHRLRAVQRTVRLGSCRRRGPETGPVVLIACGPSGSLFAAAGFPRGRSQFIGITPISRHRGLLSGSLAKVRGNPDEFTYSDDLSSATVAPGAPFRGSGSYHSDGGVGRLDGDLRGSFPATKRIRFAPGEAALDGDQGPACLEDGSGSSRPATARVTASVLRAAGIDWLR